MKDLSLHILDIAENSAKAGAGRIDISLKEENDRLELCISDDGCGMDRATLARVTDPFYTTRTTRKVGLGLPLLRQSAEQTGGSLTVRSTPKSESPERHGTTVCAVFFPRHIDMLPPGDIPQTLCTLIQGHEAIDITFSHSADGAERVRLNTAELRRVLSPVPLSQAEVLTWTYAYLNEQYEAFGRQADPMLL